MITRVTFGQGFNDAAKDAFRRPVVIYVNEFDESSARAFSEQVSQAQETGQTILPVVIDSYGGDPYALLSMLTDIDHSTIPVATIVTGKAMSCGAFLFSYGHAGHRYMSPNATIMLHDISSEASGNTADIKVDAAECERLQNILFERMAKQCGQPKRYFARLLDKNKHADLYLDADDALRHGIATTIGVPSLTTALTLTYTFGVDDTAA